MRGGLFGLLMVAVIGVTACEPGAVGTPTTTTTSTQVVPSTTTTPDTTLDSDQPDVVLSGEQEYPEGFTVPAGEVWAFDPETSTTVLAGANVIVEGRLEMRPSSGAVEHVLVFEGIDESSFVGGGMDPVESDTGLWVVGDGQLHIEGEEKTAWAYEYDPSWGDDEVLAAPNTAGAYEIFEVVTATPPANALGYQTELLNLSRNVRIEGTPDGYTHVFLRSTMPHTIRFAALRYVAPGFGDSAITGRYGLHFHMSGDGSRGTLVEGVVIRDTRNHAFVPHASHGITFQDTIAYNVQNEAYWWDEPPEPIDHDYDASNDTNDIVWDRAVAAGVTQGVGDERFRLAGFFLGNGENLTVTNSVAVGLHGDDPFDRSGFTWPEAADSVWTFENNIAHNNDAHGIFVWQNNSEFHDVEGFHAYYNGGAGVSQGAYANAYRYSGLTLLENDLAVISHALGKDRDGQHGQTWTDLITGGGVLLIEEHVLEDQDPVRFVDCDFGSVLVVDGDGDVPGEYEFVRCGMEPEDFDLTEAMAESEFRVQREDGTAYSLSGDGSVTELEPFSDD